MRPGFKIKWIFQERFNLKPVLNLRLKWNHLGASFTLVKNMYIKYVLYCAHLSNWFTDIHVRHIMEGILDAACYNRLLRHVFPRERVYITYMYIHTLVTTPWSHGKYTPWSQHWDEGIVNWQSTSWEGPWDNSTAKLWGSLLIIDLLLQQVDLLAQQNDLSWQTIPEITRQEHSFFSWYDIGQLFL